MNHIKLNRLRLAIFEEDSEDGGFSLCLPAFTGPLSRIRSELSSSRIQLASTENCCNLPLLAYG